MFSIVIATYNNLQHLQLCIKSINDNSHFLNQILVHANCGEDGTLEWLESKNIEHTFTRTNVGLCVAANLAAIKAFNKYICMVGDDEYLLPDWDYNLIKFKTDNNIPDNSWLCSTRIEPEAGASGSVQGNYGKINNFNEELLLKEYKSHISEPRVSTQITPFIIKTDIWESIGGYDEDIFVIGAEEGITKKMYDNGCRNFVCVPDSLVYHFQCISTSKLDNRIEHSRLRDKIFSYKYGMTIKDFNTIINRGDKWISLS